MGLDIETKNITSTWGKFNKGYSSKAGLRIKGRVGRLMIPCMLIFALKHLAEQYYVLKGFASTYNSRLIKE